MRAVSKFSYLAQRVGPHEENWFAVALVECFGFILASVYFICPPLLLLLLHTHTPSAGTCRVGSSGAN